MFFNNKAPNVLNCKKFGTNILFTSLSTLFFYTVRIYNICIKLITFKYQISFYIYA